MSQPQSQSIDRYAHSDSGRQHGGDCRAARGHRAVSAQRRCGRLPAKGVVGQPVVVEADIFLDGHDAPGARVAVAFQ